MGKVSQELNKFLLPAGLNLVMFSPFFLFYHNIILCIFARFLTELVSFGLNLSFLSGIQ